MTDVDKNSETTNTRTRLRIVASLLSTLALVCTLLAGPALASAAGPTPAGEDSPNSRLSIEADTHMVGSLRAPTSGHTRPFESVSQFPPATGLPVTQADRRNEAATGTSTNETDTEPANASVRIDYRGDALLHEGDQVFVWRSRELDVDVVLGPEVSGEHMCLHRRPLGEESERIECRPVASPGEPRTLSFRDVGYNETGPVVYQLDVRVYDDSDRRLTQVESTQIIQLTNWSAVDEDELQEFVDDNDLLNVSGDEANTRTATDSRADPSTNHTSSGRTPAPADDGADVVPARNLSNPPDVEDELSLPSLQAMTDALESRPVIVFGSGGVLALLALLYVRKGDEEQTRNQGGLPADAAEVHTTRPRSDTDRVVDLLARNGGRLKQSEIVEATDWSKAKVSRLLSRMEDRNRIRKEQDGRQNIIVLRRAD